MFVESNRTVSNSTKMTISIAILLGAYSSNGIGGTPINYPLLNSPTIILCFLDIAEAEFRCGWKRELFLSVCLLNTISQGIIKTPLQIISGSSVQRDVLFPVLIDNCIVLLVNVYAVFIVHAGLTLITLKNKQATFVNLRGAFIRFILWDVNLSSEVCFDNMALGLLSVDRPDL